MKTLNKHKDEFFSFISSKQTIKLPPHMPKIKQIISIIVEPELISQKTVNTTVGTSFEGDNLKGKKIIFQIKLKLKILYQSDTVGQTIHTIQDEYFQSTYISISTKIQGSNIESLLQNNQMQTKIHVINTSLKLVDGLSIFKSTLLYIHTCFIPTYELTYSIYTNQINSNIFISYEDFSKNKQITFLKNKQSIKSKWSPNGDKIAFLSNKNHVSKKFMLYIYDLKTNSIQNTPTLQNISSITSFCWSIDGQNIIFSSSFENKKDLFILNINNLKYSQLTFTHENIKNYNPKVSSYDGKIYFLRSISNIANLYTMNLNGTFMNKLTSSGYIKEFDLSKNKNFIAYIWEKNPTFNKLCFLNLTNYETTIIDIPSNILNISYIRYSPDNNFISFIGSNLLSDNIYLYHLKNHTFLNLTKYNSNIKISDFTWNIDSLNIYYAAKETNYYNIYCLNLKNKEINKITNTNSYNIKLDYRPKII